MPSPDRVPNVGSDPINPMYYAGTACAEIIDHMVTNVGLAAKYAWRLGEKDSEAQEAGKAIWYLKRQLELIWVDTHVDWTYRNLAAHRIQKAINAGKLDFIRSEIMSDLVEYTLDGATRHILRAISLFENYLEPEEKEIENAGE